MRGAVLMNYLQTVEQKSRLICYNIIVLFGRVIMRSFMKPQTIFILAVLSILINAVVIAAPMKVKVDKTTGKVETQVGAAAGWKTVANGDSVPIGATVRTGPGASCMLKWAGGNVVKVGPLSNVKVVDADKSPSGKETSALALSNGNIMAHARKLNTKDSAFSIKTPTAVAGVRGTDLFVEQGESGPASIGVVDGNVEVETGGETVEVDPGTLVTVDESGNISEPETIPPEMMQNMASDFQDINSESKSDESTYQGESGESGKSEQGGSGTSGGSPSSESAGQGGEKSADSTEGGGDNAGEQDFSAVDTMIDNAISQDNLNTVIQQADESVTQQPVEPVVEPVTPPVEPVTPPVEPVVEPVTPPVEPVVEPVTPPVEPQPQDITGDVEVIIDLPPQ
jgi:hypothetical protein